ncbi:MAG: hypothetical protein CMJ58_10150 [Planctomycetaceae bacterium]|nr:hypothetical protein [Planctomycetaceae bacterium]
MKRFTEKLVHYGVLIALTAFAVGVMVWLSAKGQGDAAAAKAQVRPLAESAAPKALVTVQPLEEKLCEVTETYAGLIRPWESYSVGFEVGGRVLKLGTNAAGGPLDDGDRVEAGQVLAVLDDRVFRAQRSEAMARLEQTTAELQRWQRAREQNPGAVSETALQTAVTDLALARAQVERATKSLEDATLRSPVAATISRRLVNEGESVAPNQVLFELLENDEVLLVISVPESRVRELQLRQQQVRRARQQAQPTSAGGGDAPGDDDAVFRAHVTLEGRDQFGRPWPPVEGEVYRIAEAADPNTTLFAVEVRLDNRQRLLRSGMVGTARLVVDRVRGYEIPASAVLYRSDKAYIFTIDSHRAPLEMLYWSLGETDVHRARRVSLPHWSNQGTKVVVPASDVQLENVITRGQYRLADGQPVRLASELDAEAVSLEAQAAASPPSLGTAQLR